MQSTRHQSAEHELVPADVANLQAKWMFTAAGDVSATPAVHGGRVYVPDWAGFLYALDRETGLPIWRASIAAASGVPGDKARTTPAVAGGKVYIGTQGPFGGGGKMLAFDADTGALIWSTQVDSHPADMDAIDALDLTTGAIRWAFEALPFDAWTVQCIFVIFDINEGNCPEPAGPDYDFSQAPPLYKTRDANGQQIELVGAGQKCGQYWTVNPDTGAQVWVTQAGPGGVAGGLQWGSAVDGDRVYTANANSQAKPWTLPSGAETQAGVWSRLDAATGQILWQTAPPHGGGTSGPVTTANGVVYGCSLDPQGYMYARDASSGAVLWEFASGGSCLSGAAISDGTLFWGSGYSNNFFGTPNDKLHAFSLP